MKTYVEKHVKGNWGFLLSSYMEYIGFGILKDFFCSNHVFYREKVKKRKKQ
jgi:hypothetical protein